VGAIVVGARPVGGGGAVAPDVVDVPLDVVDVLLDVVDVPEV